jgi:3-isopropylmalate/(R)-2-methylmalate dehydratase small subunit
MEDLDKTFVAASNPAILWQPAAISAAAPPASTRRWPSRSPAWARSWPKLARICLQNASKHSACEHRMRRRIAEGDEVEIDFDKGELKNLTKNQTAQFAPFPPFLQNIIAKGGLMNSIGTV